MKLKKLLSKAVVLAAVMTLAVSPASAATVPSSSDVGSISVTNIEHGATVKAYKIVNAEYSSAGLVGYEPVEGVTISDLENPTLQEAQAITAMIQNGNLNVSPVAMTDVTPVDSHTLGDGSTSCTYRADGLGAGMYLVLVKGVSGNVYNPAVISVGYDDSSKITSGSLDISNGNWTVSGGMTEAKHSRVTVSKDTEEGIRSFSYDDNISYVVTAAIPSYDPAVYSNVYFRLVDTADEGLTFDPGSVSVKDATGATVAQSNYSVSLSGQTLTIDFDSAWVLTNGGTSVTVNYEANLDTDAALDFTGNYNHVKIVYSNDPTSQGGAAAYDDPDDPGTPKDETVVYTFDFCFKKVDSKDPDILLPGAEFSLTGTNTTGDSVTYTETSSDEGVVHFSGLSEGTYTMTETKAPEGYAVNRNVYTVTISPTYGSDKTLTSYTVTIVDQEGTAFMNKTYTQNPAADGSDGYIPNTAFMNLPATGGTGTVMYSLMGVTAITFGTLILMRRKRTLSSDLKNE